MNLYAYVGNDAVNFTDPLGLDRGLNYPAGWADDVPALPPVVVPPPWSPAPQSPLVDSRDIFDGVTHVDDVGSTASFQ